MIHFGKGGPRMVFRMGTECYLSILIMFKIWYVYLERWLHIYSRNRIQDSSETKHFHVILLDIAFLVQNLKPWQPFCPCVFPLVEDGLSACVEFFSYSRFDGRECIENKFLSLSKFCGCFYSFITKLVHLMFSFFLANNPSDDEYVI